MLVRQKPIGPSTKPKNLAFEHDGLVLVGIFPTGVIGRVRRMRCFDSNPRGLGVESPIC